MDRSAHILPFHLLDDSLQVPFQNHTVCTPVSSHRDAHRRLGRPPTQKETRNAQTGLEFKTLRRDRVTVVLFKGSLGGTSNDFPRVDLPGEIPTNPPIVRVVVTQGLVMLFRPIYPLHRILH